MILGNHDFFSFGFWGCFGVGGSIRLAKLVCLLLARASQPSQKANIFKKCVQSLRLRGVGKVQQVYKE